MKLICLALVATVAMSAELRLTNAGGACSLRKQGSTVLSTCDFSTRTTSLSRGTTYVTLEVYGYVPADSTDVHFIEPQNIRTTGSGCRTSTQNVPSNVPANAVPVPVSSQIKSTHRVDPISGDAGTSAVSSE